jgi:hypothetical protein
MRSLGLAVVAALALTAFLGASATPAAASWTSLCKANESPCAPGNQYGAFVASSIEASTDEMVITLPFPDGKVAKVTCTASSLDIGTTSANGNPLKAWLANWAMSGCTTSNGTVSCTATPLESGASGSLSWTKGAEGTLSSSEEGVYLLCKTTGGSTVTDCTFSFKSPLQLDVVGGNPAHVVAGEEPMTKSGKLCVGLEPKFTATYEIDSPQPLYVVPPAPAKFAAVEPEYPLLLDGLDTGAHTVLNTGVSGTSCTDASLANAVLGEPEETIIATPAYSGCTVGGLATTLNTNGCEFQFHAGPGGVPFNGTGSMDIVGCAGSGITWSTVFCNYTIPTQTGLSVNYKNVIPGGGASVIDATLSTSSLKYSQSGAGCTSKTGEGSYSGAWRVSGENSEEDPIEIWVE